MVKSSENYERRFMMTFPNETLPKGRRQKTTAIYDRLTARGAVWSQSFGLEHALWFANGPEDAHEAPTFERSHAHDYVAREVKAVREAVGALEVANYSKHEFKGSGARAALDHLLAGRVPKPGRLALTPMLTKKGSCTATSPWPAWPTIISCCLAPVPFRKHMGAGSNSTCREPAWPTAT